MQVEFESMAALLVPGYQPMIYAHFGLTEEFAERMTGLSDDLADHVNELLRDMYASGDLSQMHESFLLKKAFALVDQHVRPQTAAEIICAAFVVSTLLGHLGNILISHSANLMAQLQQPPTKQPIFYGSDTATA